MHLPDYNPDIFPVLDMIDSIVSVFAMLSAFTSIIILPFSAILTTRRFDPMFRNNNIYLLCMGRLMRGAWYSCVMVVPKRFIRKGSIMDRTFHGYDLWSNASRLERTLASIHIYSGLLFILGGFIYVIMYIIYLFQIY